MRRLDKDREAEPRELRGDRVRLRAPAPLPDAAERDLRQTGGSHQLLEADLVHAQRGGGDAAAHVGHVERLQHALDDPVLPEGPVQRGEGDVRTEQPGGRSERERRAVVQPAPVARDLDLDRLVAPREQALTHRRRRCQRDLVLGGPTTAQHRDEHQVAPVTPVGPLGPLGPVEGPLGPVEGPLGPVDCGAT